MYARVCVVLHNNTYIIAAAAFTNKQMKKQQQQEQLHIYEQTNKTKLHVDTNIKKKMVSNVSKQPLPLLLLLHCILQRCIYSLVHCFLYTHTIYVYIFALCVCIFFSSFRSRDASYSRTIQTTTKKNINNDTGIESIV